MLQGLVVDSADGGACLNRPGLLALLQAWPQSRDIGLLSSGGEDSDDNNGRFGQAPDADLYLKASLQKLICWLLNRDSWQILLPDPHHPVVFISTTRHADQSPVPACKIFVLSRSGRFACRAWSGAGHVCARRVPQLPLHLRRVRALGGRPHVRAAQPARPMPLPQPLLPIRERARRCLRCLLMVIAAMPGTLP